MVRTTEAVLNFSIREKNQREKKKNREGMSEGLIRNSKQG